MLDIRTDKVVRVIFLAREYGPDSPHLREYISGLNDDEAVSLVATMWVGRGSFEPEDVKEAIETARAEATAPTEAYLAGIPELPDLLEDGMDALGISVADAEDHLRG
ncbi:MAG: DUF3775 domain-containing protein [Pseudomonadota bacterium]